MSNRFYLWGAARARFPGPNTPMVTEFVCRSLSVPHTSQDKTPSSLFLLAALYFDEQRADTSLWQMDKKLHKKECNKVFPSHISVEILFAEVSFAMYTTLTIFRVMKCKLWHQTRGSHCPSLTRGGGGWGDGHCVAMHLCLHSVG